MRSPRSYKVLQLNTDLIYQYGEVSKDGIIINNKNFRNMVFDMSGKNISENNPEADAAINIPYNGALRQIFLVKENSREDILKKAENGPSNNSYYIKTLIYIDLNGKVSILEELMNGLTIEFDKGTNIKFVLFERSASQTRTNILVLIDELLYRPYGELRQRIRCGLDEYPTVIISKFAAYRSLLMTAGICVDTGNELNAESVMVIPDHRISVWRKLCREMGTVFEFPSTVKVSTVNKDDSLKNIEFTAAEENVEDDKLFDGEGIIAWSLAESIAQKVSYGHSGTRGKDISSFQIRMPFVKGVLHKVDFHSILNEMFNGEKIYLKDIFGRLHPLENVKMILTKSMFKMTDAYKEKYRSESSGYNPGWDKYWEYFNKYDHRLFISNTDEVYRTESELTISNYQFLSTLEETDGKNDRRTALLEPSVSAMRTSFQSSESLALNYLMKSRVFTVNEDTDSDDDISQPDKTDVDDVDLLKKNPALIKTSVFRDRIRKSTLMHREYSYGHIYQPGKILFISGSLIQFFCILAGKAILRGEEDKIYEKSSEENENEKKVLDFLRHSVAFMDWMYEGADAVIPLYKNNEDNLDELFRAAAPDRLIDIILGLTDELNSSEGKFAERAALLMTPVISGSCGKNSLKKEWLSELKENWISENAGSFDNRLIFNKWAAQKGVYTAAYYAPGGPRRRAVLNRNPHLSRPEHVIMDPAENCKIRDKYFGHLKGTVMIRVGIERNLQRLSGADFDGDHCRLYFSDAYISAAMKSIGLPPLTIPGQTAKSQKYTDEAKKELVRRSSESRVGRFSNYAFKTSLYSYGFRKLPDGKDISSEAEKNLIELSCCTGLEIDSVKTGVKPDYDSKRLAYNTKDVNERKKDTAKLKFFLDYKNSVKKKKSFKTALEFLKDGSSYSLVENLPYIFWPSNLVIADGYKAENWAEDIQKIIWTNTGGSNEAKPNDDDADDNIVNPDDTCGIKRKYIRCRDFLTTSDEENQYFLWELTEPPQKCSFASADKPAQIFFDSYCALRAYFNKQTRKGKAEKNQKFIRLRTILVNKYGDMVGSRIAKKLNNLKYLFDSAEKIENIISCLIPWVNFPNAQMRLVYFNYLAEKHGIEFRAKSGDAFDILCCRFDANISESAELAGILLTEKDPEKIRSGHGSKVVKLWHTLHTCENADENYTEKLKAIAEELYRLPDIDWLRETDDTRRKEHYIKIIPENIRKHLPSEAADLFTAAANWQVLPAYLDYCRSSVETVTRSKNNEKFHEKASEWLYESFGINAKQEDANDTPEEKRQKNMEYFSDSIERIIRQTAPDTNILSDNTVPSQLTEALEEWYSAGFDAADIHENSVTITNGEKVTKTISKSAAAVYCILITAGKELKYGYIAQTVLSKVYDEKKYDSILYQLLSMAYWLKAQKAVKAEYTGIESFAYQYLTGHVYSSLRTDMSIIHGVNDFVPDYSAGFIDGCQGIAFASNDSKYKYITAAEEKNAVKGDGISITIRTAAGGNECLINNPEDDDEILKKYITVENADFEYSIRLKDRDKIIREGNILRLYSVAFEICKKDKAVFSGAFTHLRLPDDKNYQDLAEPVSAVITVSDREIPQKSDVGFVFTENRCYYKKNLNKFIFGYKKFEKTKCISY